MNRDRFFGQVAPAVLCDLAGYLGWNPAISATSARTLSSLPLSERLAWLDEHRTDIEDRISYLGTSSVAYLLGERKSYRDIVISLADKVSASSSPSQTTAEIEMAIVGKLWQNTLSKLSSEQVEALKIKVAKLAAEHGQQYGKEFTGFAALGAAQLSGFGVYLFGSTLLGAINSAFGLGLGFGAFTGLSSLISTLIGPVGWAALGLFTVLKLGAPNYKKLLPVIIFIATQRSVIDNPDISAVVLSPSVPSPVTAASNLAHVAPEHTPDEDTNTDGTVAPPGPEQVFESIARVRATSIPDKREPENDASAQQRPTGAQRRGGPTQPRPLSKADKRTFSLRNPELCRISEELESERHFLEWTADEQELIRLLHAERQQLVATANAAPDAPAGNGTSNKKLSCAAEITITKTVRQRDVNQWCKRYRHYFPDLRFSTDSMLRLAQMPEQKRLGFESEFSRMNRGNLEDKHHVPRTKPKLFVREAGGDGRAYYRREISAQAIFIYLVGDKHTETADYRAMQQ